MIKERPILFSAPMIRAILDGRKTQTRRIIKHQPPDEGYQLSWLINTTDSSKKHLQGKAHWINMSGKKTSNKSEVYLNCPYGKPGDRLWVRETWQGPILNEDEYEELRRDGREQFLKTQYCVYRATDKLDAVDVDGNELAWKPSIHMPRWASRILLEITNVRVERLQGIREEDAKAEGAYPIDFGFGDCYAMGFIEIWESINGIGSWDSNPFCWVIEFKVLSK